MTGNRMMMHARASATERRSSRTPRSSRAPERDRLFVSDTSAYLKDFERTLGATLYDAQHVGDLPPEHDPHRLADDSSWSRSS